MRAYLLGIICAAFLVSILDTVGGKGPGKGMRRLVGGIFLSLAVLGPLGGLDLPEPELERFRADAARAAEAGSAQAADARSDIIKDALEAYIWNKAAELGLSPEVRVELDPEGMPAAVALTGKASPSERETLLGWIARDLGLGREAVTWNISYQSSE